MTHMPWHAMRSHAMASSFILPLARRTPISMTMARGSIYAYACIVCAFASFVCVREVAAAAAPNAVSAFARSSPHSRIAPAYVRPHARHAKYHIFNQGHVGQSRLSRELHTGAGAGILRRSHALVRATSSPAAAAAAFADNDDDAAAKPISTADSLKSSLSSSSSDGGKNTRGGGYRYHRYPSRRLGGRRLFASTRRKSLPKWFRRLLMSSKFSSMATRLRESAANRKGETNGNDGGEGGLDLLVDGESQKHGAISADRASSSAAGADVSARAATDEGAVAAVVAGHDVGNGDGNGDSDGTNTNNIGNERKQQQRRPLPGSRTLRLILSAPLVEFKLSLLVLLSSVFVAAGTVAGLPAPIHAVMNFAEDGIALLFLLEYLLRWYCNGLRPSHVLKPLVIVDLLSVLPLATNLVTTLPFGSKVLQDHLLVNLRLLRLLRFQRFLVDFETFERFQVATGLRFGQDNVRKYHLQLARVILTIFTLLTVSAGLVYTAEHVVNPAFTDFPSSLYFVLTTVTTVGFGDIVPMTALGRMAVCATILAGAAIIPLQVTAFVDALLDFRRDLEAKKSLSKKGANGDLLEDELLYEETDVLQADGSYRRTKTSKLLACSICEEKPHREKARYCWACGSPLTLSKWGNLRIESNSEALAQ